MITKHRARWLSSALSLAVLAAVSAGAPANAEDNPQSGGTLTVVLSDYPVEGLNPHHRGAISQTQAVRNVYDALIAIDYDESFHPWLAESWTRSDDGLVWTFKLKQGVKFTDGEPFNAQAVKANFDLVIDGKYAPSAAKNSFRSLKETRVVDDHTVEFVLSNPAANFLHTLASLEGSIVSPKSLQNPDVRAGGVGIAGTGPFILTEVVPGQELVFVRNENYNSPPATAHHTGPAFIEKLVIKYVSEPSVRAGLLASGEVQAITDVAPNDIPLFDGVDGYHFEYKGSNTAPTSLYFNTTSGPTQDVRVRKALQEGADIDGIIKSVLKGQGERAWSILQPQSKFYDAKYEGAYGGNVELANKLLDEAGWTERDAEGYRTNASGQRLTLRLIATNPKAPLDTVLAAYQSEVRQNLGAEIDLQYRDEGTVDKVREANAYEIFPRSIGGTDASTVLDKVYTKDGTVNGPRLDSPEVTKWLEEGRYALTDEARKAAFDKIAQYVLIDQSITLPLYLDRYNVAALSSVHDVTAFIDPPRGLLNGWAYNTWIDQQGQ